MKKVLSIIAILLLITCIFASCDTLNNKEADTKNTDSIFRQSVSTTYDYVSAKNTTTQNLTPFQKVISTYSKETMGTQSTTKPTETYKLPFKTTVSLEIKVNKKGVHTYFEHE